LGLIYIHKKNILVVGGVWEWEVLAADTPFHGFYV